MALDAIDDFDEGIGFSPISTLSSTIHLNEREDAATIQKVKSLELPPLPFSSASLEGRVTEGQISTQASSQKTSIESLQEVLLEKLGEEPSYLQNISNLVGKLLEQLSKIGEKDRIQIDDMKKKYENSYKISADLVKSIAWNNLWTSGFALFPLVLSFSENRFDQNMGKNLSEQFVPGLGRMFTSGKEADMKKADSLSQLLMQEYGAKTSKSSSEGNNKQEITNMLDKAVSALKEAARAG